MKKTILATLLVSALLAITSCASNKKEEAPAEPAPSAAKTAAMKEAGAIDLGAFESPDKWAIKYNEDDYTLTVKGAEFFYFELPEELIPGETVVTVHLTGTNNGVEGFRSWIDTGSQKDLSDPWFTGAIGEGLAAGNFDLTYELNANKGEGGKYLWIKGPRWGTCLDDLVFKSVSVTYN